MLKIKNIFGKKRQPQQQEEELAARGRLKVPMNQDDEDAGSGSTLMGSFSPAEKDKSSRSLTNSDNTLLESEVGVIRSEPDMEADDTEDSLSVSASSETSLEEVPEAHFEEQEELLNFTLINQIGEGAFSRVFRGIPRKNSPKAFLTRNFQEVAVKVIRKEQGKGKADKKHEETKKSTREQVLREVQIHRLISSSGSNSIVQFIDFQESENFFYIIQELLNGGEIFGEIVKYTYFSEDLSRHVVKPLALAVKHMHQMGVVHRDIKPENLLFEHIKFVPSKQIKLRKSDDPATKADEGEFRPDVGGGGIGVVKLADFGLSKQIHQTNTKTPCGTVGYTAPEVVRDERYSMEVDMWGIGCVLYTMLCGFPPFYDEKIDILTEKIARGEFTFLQPWWDEISDGAKNCVRRLLEVDPVKRYSIEDLLNDEWLNTFDSVREEQLIKKKRQARAMDQQRKSKNHMSNKNRIYYLKKDNPLMYSPVANAMRDAFDISNALQRSEVEKRERQQQYLPTQSALGSLTEGEVALGKAEQQAGLGADLFQLKLNSSTIIKRRKDNTFPSQRNMMIPTLLE